MKQPKAVLYIRVSTGQQAEQGTSLDVQEEACVRKAKEIGAQIVDIISDEGVSGGLYLSRPGIQKALALLEAREADTLITLKLDRSGRDADVLSLIRKRIHNAGAELVFVDGASFEDNAAGNLMFLMSAGFAQFEKEVIRERTMSGRRKRAEQGQQPTRSRHPFGYRIVCKEDVLRGDYALEQLGTYQIAAEQAQWAKQMFLWYAAGASLRQVCRYLQEQGVQTPQNGAVWLPGTIKIVLSNPVYKGTPQWGKKQRRTDEGRLQRGMTRPDYVVSVPEEKRLHLSAPPLVDAATWDTCQERLSGNQSTLGGNPERRFLLSGLLRCPKCGRSMSGEHNKGRRYYNCTASRTMRAISGYQCMKAMLRADAVEDVVMRDIKALAHQPEQFASALQAYVQMRAEANALPDDGERLRRELAELAKQEDAAAAAQIAAITKGRNADVYERLLSDIDSRRKEVQAQLAQVKVPAALPVVNARTEAEKIAEVFRRMEAVLADADVSTATKHLILSKVIRTIKPEGEGYEVELLPSASSGLGTVEYISIR